MHRTGKWLLFEPTEIERPLSKLDEIFHREDNPYSDSLNRNKSKTKDVAVQTDPDTAKYFPLKIPSPKNSVEELLRNPNAWNQPALKNKLNATAVPVRIKGDKRSRNLRNISPSRSRSITHISEFTLSRAHSCSRR